MNAAMTGKREDGERKASRFAGFWCRANIASMLCWMSAIWAVPACMICALATALAGLTGFLGTPVNPGIDYDDHGVIAVVALLWLLFIGVLCFALILWLVGFLIGRSVPKGERGSRVRLWGLVALAGVVIVQATLWFLSCRLLIARSGPLLGWAREILGEIGIWYVAIGAVLVLLPLSTGMAALLAWENNGRRRACKTGAGVIEESAVSAKSRLVALLLCLFLGAFGAHRYYIGKMGTGTAMLPLGILGVASISIGGPFLVIVVAWALVDLLRIAAGNMRDMDEGRITEWQRRKELAS